jgi:Conjugal transfer protein TraD
MDRKKDTRSKIQLGGLVVKAGLRDLDKAVILGILIDASQRLDDRHAFERWRAIGKAAFKQDTEFKQDIAFTQNTQFNDDTHHHDTKADHSVSDPGPRDDHGPLGTDGD